MSAKQVGFRSGAQKTIWCLNINLNFQKKKKKLLGLPHPPVDTRGDHALIPFLPMATPCGLGVGGPHLPRHTQVCTSVRTHTHTHIKITPVPTGVTAHTDMCCHGNMGTEYIAGSPHTYFQNSVSLVMSFLVSLFP